MRGLSWRPAGRRVPVLHNLDLRVEAGQKVLLAGPSGSGKSTLLRAMAGVLLTTDVGELSGTVAIDGTAPLDRAGQVGLLLQDPSAAVVADRVGRDVAFGLENVGVPRTEIAPRVSRALEEVNLHYDARRRTRSLSGGETQRLALAGALAMEPRVLLLDEPTSMLDPDNAAAVRRAVLERCADRGMTLIVVEHRLAPWVEHVDRCVVLGDDGSVVADGRPGVVLSANRTALAARGIWVPGVPAPEPRRLDAELVAPWSQPPPEQPLVSAEDITVRYGPTLVRRDTPGEGLPALFRAHCRLLPRRPLVLTGPSGSGKSTLLAVLAGLLRPDDGRADVHPDLAGRHGTSVWRLTSRELAGRLAWVPQTPAHGVVGRTVMEDMLVTSRALERPAERSRGRAGGLLEALRLSHLSSVSPFRLSGGEQRRLAVASALVHGPLGVLLDEPTVGQDRRTWAAVVGAVESALDAGVAAAVATHDEETGDRLTAGAGQRVRLDQGRTT